MKYIIIVVAAIWLTACDWLPTPENIAKNAVSNVLIDPDSAKFSNIIQGVKPGDYCGTVNGKNRMGGYAGSSPFIYESGNSQVSIYNVPTRFDFLSYKDAVIVDDKEADRKFLQITEACKFPKKWKQVCQIDFKYDEDTSNCDDWLKGGDAVLKMLLKLKGN